ncbi:type II toxin-antitoxin system VapB family antitoxin [Sphingomonas bacterium]|uniref:type II toxin-antitoxin system VapB family antitoxin n=1 Tax=Sphingomonas bacterium TaxID=1895847 RepID=UPI001575E80A|nr:type II toxin-antitoxin system VapB family antitoxin [Sphingomonas bacterium]
MKIEVEIEDTLLAKAEAAVDMPSRSELVSEALRSLIHRQASRELILLGGSDPNATAAPRRRFF